MVTGATETTLVAAAQPEFWSALGEAMGVPDATQSTFAGSLPVPKPTLCSPDVLGENGGIDAQIQINRLTVVRVPLGSGLRFDFARRVVSTSPRKVQAVATLLCELPLVPTSSAASCQAASSASYRLTFNSPAGASYSATVDAKGCEAVSGVVPPDTLTAAIQPTFWVTLAKAIGIANPGHAAFVGTKVAA